MRASAPHACSSTLGMPPSILPPSLEAFAVRAAGHTYILHAHLMGAAPALLSAQCNLEKLVSRSGNASAAWWLCSDGLSSASRVISLGIRSDALFEVEFVRRFLGARVFAFDSTMSANEFRRIIDTNPPARTSSEQRMLKFWSFRIERVLELACLARADVMKIDLAAATWGLFERGNASRFFGTDSGMAALLRRVPPLQISIATRGGDDTYGAAATPLDDQRVQLSVKSTAWRIASNLQPAPRVWLHTTTALTVCELEQSALRARSHARARVLRPRAGNTTSQRLGPTGAPTGLFGRRVENVDFGAVARERLRENHAPGGAG